MGAVNTKSNKCNGLIPCENPNPWHQVEILERCKNIDCKIKHSTYSPRSHSNTLIKCKCNPYVDNRCSYCETQLLKELNIKH